MMAAALAAVLPAPVAGAGTQMTAPCPAAHRRVDYPGIAPGAAPIAVVFGCSAVGRPVSAIYVLAGNAWQLVHAGDFVRGSMLSGRGGKDGRYRLVDSAEGFADLKFVNGALVLAGDGGSVELHALPARE